MIVHQDLVRLDQTMMIVHQDLVRLDQTMMIVHQDPVLLDQMVVNVDHGPVLQGLVVMKGVAIAKAVPENISERGFLTETSIFAPEIVLKVANSNLCLHFILNIRRQ